MKIGVLGFSSKGKALANNIVTYVEEAKIVPNKKIFVEENFNEYQAWIFVGAVGIAVRYIGGLIQGKTKDPAVIVVDELGNYIIPILSGHIGGANELAEKVAKLIGGRAVITTATDINGVLAIDSYAVANNLAIVNPQNIKLVSSSLLEGENVGFYTDVDDFEVIEGLDTKAQSKVGVCVSYNEKLKPFDNTLNLVPKNLILGIGCRKNTPIEKMKTWIDEELNKRELSKLGIRAIVSIDIKSEEEAIIQLAKDLGVEFITYSSDTLCQVEGEFSSSEFVNSITGVDNVCERAVVAYGGKLMVNKTKGEGMTLAVGRTL